VGVGTTLSVRVAVRVGNGVSVTVLRVIDGSEKVTVAVSISAYPTACNPTTYMRDESGVKQTLLGLPQLARSGSALLTQVLVVEPMAVHTAVVARSAKRTLLFPTYSARTRKRPRGSSRMYCDETEALVP
jgi:hypothetical protein